MSKVQYYKESVRRLGEKSINLNVVPVEVDNIPEYQQLKRDLDWIMKVHPGNLKIIIDGMREKYGKIIPPKEKE